MPGRLIESKNTEAAGILIKDLTQDTPDPSDIIPFFDLSGDDTNKATIQEIVSAGLPHGTSMGELLAWSTVTNRWAPLPFAPLAVHLAGGSAGALVVQTGVDHTTYLAKGTANQILAMDQTGTAPVWVNGNPPYTTANAGQFLGVKPDGTGLEWGSKFLDKTKAEAFVNTFKNLTSSVVIEMPVSIGGLSLDDTFKPSSVVFNGLIHGGQGPGSGNSIYISGIPNATSLAFPSLVNANSFVIINCPKVATATLPAIRSISREFRFTFLAELTSLQISDYMDWAELFEVSWSGKITTLVCPLRNVGRLVFDRCTSLTTLSIPYLRNMAGNLSATFCALSQSSVDGILQRLANMNGKNGTTEYGSGLEVNLSGGTSAAPSATGLTAKNTLVARGCTVTTN
jgi:hypothetical protein